jgi:DNA-binding beta-propeller fold protein YncE
MSFGTCYPFGVALNGAQTRAYVGTVDGSGVVYALDIDVLSPTQWTEIAADRITVPGGPTFGRLAFRDATTLVLPYSTTDFVTWDDHVATYDVSTSSSPTLECDVFYAQDGFGPQDVAVRSDGIAFVATSASSNGDVWVLDLDACTAVAPITTGIQGMHGIGLTPDERILIATAMAPGALAIVDAVGEAHLYNLDLGLFGPNDVAFDAASAQAFVTDQFGNALGVLGGIPTGLRLAGDPAPAIGTTTTLELDGAPVGAVAAFLLSFTGNGPLQVGPYTLLVDPPIFVVGTQAQTSAGPATVGIPIPPNPSLMGLGLYWQGISTGLATSGLPLWTSNGVTQTIS